MSCILHIETSTAVCSVAVSEDGQNIFVKEDLKGPSHAVSLGVFVDEALSFIDSHAIPLDAVAVSCGPGSYTGLRIGVSMAKGICYGRNVPLIGIPTLEVLSVPVLLYHELPEDALLCPMIDARRMEVYAAIYDRALNVKREISADIVDENSYLEYLEPDRIDRRQEDDDHQRDLEVAVDGDQTRQGAEPVRVQRVVKQRLDEHRADAVDAERGDERKREHHAAELGEHRGDGRHHAAQQAVGLRADHQSVGGERAGDRADQGGGERDDQRPQSSKVPRGPLRFRQG